MTKIIVITKCAECPYFDEIDPEEPLEEPDQEVPLLSQEMVTAILTLVERLPSEAVIHQRAGAMGGEQFQKNDMRHAAI